MLFLSLSICRNTEVKVEFTDFLCLKTSTSCFFVYLLRFCIHRWHDSCMQDACLANNDRLSRMLHTFRMRSTFYCNAVLTEPWSLQVPSIPDSVSCHV